MPSIRDNHFARLNSYRNSREYAEYSAALGNPPPEGATTAPSLLGERWAITADIYNEFLEILPPMRWRGGTFLMREFTFGNFTAKYTKEGDRYYCEFVDVRKERV